MSNNLIALAGGDNPSSILSILGAEHSHSRGILGFFSTKEARALRLICREFRDEVTNFKWDDINTFVHGDLRLWRTCFPKAIAANVSYREKRPGDVELLCGIHYIEVYSILFLQSHFTEEDFQVLRESYPGLIVQQRLAWKDDILTWN